jgi:hypothetical protein
VTETAVGGRTGKQKVRKTQQAALTSQSTISLPVWLLFSKKNNRTRTQKDLLDAATSIGETLGKQP